MRPCSISILLRFCSPPPPSCHQAKPRHQHQSPQVRRAQPIRRAQPVRRLPLFPHPHRFQFSNSRHRLHEKDFYYLGTSLRLRNHARAFSLPCVPQIGPRSHANTRNPPPTRIKPPGERITYTHANTTPTAAFRHPHTRCRTYIGLASPALSHPMGNLSI